MLQNFYNKFYRFYTKQVDGTGLAIFRIIYCIVLLGEIIHLFYYRHLVFDKIPYLIPGEIDMAPAIYFWIISVVALMFGFKTKISALINYLLTVVIVGTASSFEYHMFYVYIGINLFMIFLPVNRCISLDRLFLKLKYSNTKFRYQPPKTVSAVSYFLPVFAGIGLVYFDSIFHKMSSDYWMRGLGVWLPSVMPQTVNIDTTFVMNMKWLVLLLGYLTVAFEFAFIFIFFRKKWRLICLIIGLGLHIGILICYPIPFFALGVAAIYLLLIPVSFWKKFLLVKDIKENKKLIFYYDMECPLCTRTRIILEHLDTRKAINFVTVQQSILQEDSLVKDIPVDILLSDIHSVDLRGNIYSGVDTYIRVFNVIWYLKPLSWLLRIPGIYHIAKKIYKYVATNRTTERCTEDNCGYTVPALPVKDSEMKILTNYTLADLKGFGFFVSIVFICLFQLVAIYNSPSLNNIKEKLGAQSKIMQVSSAAAAKITNFTTIYFGISKHGVFMDEHFYKYNHSIGVVYKNGNKEVWLPLTTEKGTPGRYLIGQNWVKYTFRVNGPFINQDKLKDGIRDFTAFWAHKNGISLEDAEFEIRVKKNEQPTEWEKDFLHKQLSNPWISAGKVHWKNNQFVADIVDIESL